MKFLYPGHTYIIAEAGVNHNGQLDLAHKLIDVAADAGADAVKFQTFRAEGVATKVAPKAAYQVATTGSEGNQLDMIRQLELSEKFYPELISHAENRSITFLSTPHDWEAIDILDRFNIPAFKVGSGDLTNIPFLRYMAGKGRPIILSTGMSNLQEVKEAVEAIRSQGNNQIILLHCVTSYPASLKDVNLKAMATLEQSFNLPVGYSDHTEGTEAALAAVALGAKVLEKHFTIDQSLPGPDHLASLSPDGLRNLIKGIRHTELTLGDGVKQPVLVELDIAPVARKSIIAAHDLAKGSIITESMVTTKRPGTGISPKHWDQLIGKRLKISVAKDTLLTWDQIAEKADS